MKKYVLQSAVLLLVGILLFPNTIYASSGTIDAIYKYAWAENLGWINFGTPEGVVTVTDTQLTGYAWNENTGWINLAVSNTVYVANDGQGNLSGYAWGEGIGYINFAGVSIDTSGYFHGYASNTNSGQISFNCGNTNTCANGNFATKTNWQKTVAPVSRSSGGGGGHIISQAVLSPTVATLVSSDTSIKNTTTKKTDMVTMDKKECSPYLKKFIKKGKENSTEEVQKLQSFLAQYEGFAALKKTGIYDTQTMNAVLVFQNKYANDILGPWNSESATGYVYKTTKNKINELYCRYQKKKNNS